MFKYLFSSALLSLFLWNSVGMACNGYGYSYSYEEAKSQAIQDCESNKKIKSRVCQESNQWFYASACDFRGAAQNPNGYWQAYARPMHCECRR